MTAVWTTAGTTDFMSNVPAYSSIEHLGTRYTLLGCAINNSAAMSEQDGVEIPVGDPTETALLVAGAKCGLDKEAYA